MVDGPASREDEGTQADRWRLTAAVAAALGLLGGAVLVVLNATDEDATTGATRPATVATSTTLVPFPPARESLSHGGDSWAVVLAGATDVAAPVVVEAAEQARAAGYSTGPTDCDSGAAEALGFGGSGLGFYTVSVYFDTEPLARQALNAFRARGFEGGAVALVQTFCLD